MMRLVWYKFAGRIVLSLKSPFAESALVEAVFEWFVALGYEVLARRAQSRPAARWAAAGQLPDVVRTGR